MKYSIGDYVKVRNFEEMCKEFGTNYQGTPRTYLWFAREMEQYCGRIARIVDFEDDYYRLDLSSGFLWSDQMLEDVDGNKTETEITTESDVFNEFFDSIPSKDKIVTDEEIRRLCEEGRELLTEYGYGTDCIESVLDEWATSKRDLIGLFKQHPNYNGNFQIVFDSDYERPMNRFVIAEVMNWMRKHATPNPETRIYPFFTLDEVCTWRDKCATMASYIRAIRDSGYDALINGKDESYYNKEMQRWDRIYYEMSTIPSIAVNGKVYKDKFYREFCNLAYEFYLKPERVRPVLDSEFADFFNGYIPEVKAREGQRFMKVFGKAARMAGCDKAENWGKQFARLGDAVTPLSIKRHTVLSVNPVDYWTMSFGDSWASCHTIDKQNKRDMPNSYEGQYSAGTESYMLDTTSFIYYTVDASYDGDVYELEPKCTRQMFHLGEDKLVQGRLYPQGNDGADAAYKETREIVQKVIADCFGVPNYWHNKKGRGNCEDAIETRRSVLNYCDYFEYGNCNVSYLKVEGKELNTTKINVGCNEIICPACGEWHSEQGNISCCDMKNLIYCEYHNEYEHLSEDEYTYIDGYGSVCNDALEYSESFERCENCEEWFHVDSSGVVHTTDDHFYCSSFCAERDGYRECESCGDWVDEDNFINETDMCVSCTEDEYEWCSHCETWVLKEDYDFEQEMCKSCLEEEAYEDENEVA